MFKEFTCLHNEISFLLPIKRKIKYQKSSIDLRVNVLVVFYSVAEFLEKLKFSSKHSEEKEKKKKKSRR